jgi:hypothetical protein
MCIKVPPAATAGKSKGAIIEGLRIKSAGLIARLPRCST